MVSYTDSKEMTSMISEAVEEHPVTTTPAGKLIIVVILC